MSIKRTLRRVLAPIAATALLSGAVVSLAAGPAEASSIPNGYLQLCAQGGYAAQLTVYPTEQNGNVTEFHFSVAEGTCYIQPVDTYGETAWVEVDEADGTLVGYATYNSDGGLGLGAEGSAGSPWVQNW